MCCGGRVLPPGPANSADPASSSSWPTRDESCVGGARTELLSVDPGGGWGLALPAIGREPDTGLAASSLLL